MKKPWNHWIYEIALFNHNKFQVSHNKLGHANLHKAKAYKHLTRPSRVAGILHYKHVDVALKYDYKQSKWSPIAVSLDSNHIPIHLMVSKPTIKIQFHWN